MTPQRDAAGNVLARFGPPEGDAVVLAAHLDTVFAADTPLDPRREGDRLLGPAVGDDSLGLAGVLHVARHFAARPPARPVVLAATVGEEGLGDLRGARALLDHVACEAFVAIEGHGRDTLQVAGIGSARLRLDVRGPGGHSWGDRGTPSAVHALVHACAAVLAAAGDAHVNVGVVAGGTTVNTIAAAASADVDLRDAEEERLEATVRRVTAAARAAVPAGVELRVEPIGRRPAGATPPGHPLVAAARAARERAGLPPAEESASSTDANAALGRGIPAICVGLTEGGGAHTVDEYVELGPLQGGLAALETLAEALGVSG